MIDDTLGNRKHPRCKDQLPVTVDGKRGCTINIGIGGMLALIESQVSTMEPIVITIGLPENIVKVDATCLRCEVKGDKYKVAIFFDETTFTRDDIEELRKYLNINETASLRLI